MPTAEGFGVPPARCVVTGVAGFVGSHLAERLLAAGHEVVGVDRFSAHYARVVKEGNVAALRGDGRFVLHEIDLAEAPLDGLVRGADVVFHLAAQAGVRSSWGAEFPVYARDNVVATQRLLEAARTAGVARFVYASSSSVYGENRAGAPMAEDDALTPLSPYGVTKLAGEQLCHLYREIHGLSTIALRYFTVYGPRQRPDMAFSRFVRAIAERKPVTVLGDGLQRRDFTFVDDVVDANLLAWRGPATSAPSATSAPGAAGAFNVAGGESVTVLDVLDRLEAFLGPATRVFTTGGHDEVRVTAADLGRARTVLGYAPRVDLDAGLRRMVTALVPAPAASPSSTPAARAAR